MTRSMTCAAVFAAALVACVGGAAHAQQTSATEVVEASPAITNLYALEQAFVNLQYQFLPIVPPGMNLLVQPYGETLAFDWRAFPKEFSDGLVGVYQFEKIPVYGITVLEDPITRYTYFLNADKKIIYGLPPPKGYDPYAYATSRMPTLFNGARPDQEVADFAWLYDPARVAGVFSLVPSENWDDFQEYEAKASAESESKGGGGGMMLMMMSGNSNDFYIGSMEQTNGMELGINVPSGTNFTVDVFTFDATSAKTFNGLVSVWSIAATNLVAVTNIVVWTDTNYTASVNRFYGAGNGDLDTDGDGLPDGREIFTYKSDTGLLDTDGDGMQDGVEVAQGFNPAVSNGAAVVRILWPVNGGSLP